MQAETRKILCTNVYDELHNQSCNQKFISWVFLPSLLSLSLLSFAPPFSLPSLFPHLEVAPQTSQIIIE